MNDDSKGRALAILTQALDQPEAHRQAFIEGACGGDAALLTEVQSLLASHARAGEFMANPTASVPPGQGAGVDLLNSPGTSIGPYRLLQVIGEGGFGMVYMAEQTHPVHRKVAVKVIKLGMDTRQVIARFEAERQALAIMDHPHIAKVLDAGATDAGRPYFVMELVRGVPITDYCDTNNLPLPDRLELFVQVCKAVQHAHSKGIIHRDLKPSNVMVCMAEGKPSPKIIDFGIAKATDQRLTEKTIFTEFRQMIGTPQYMSPEQAEMAGIDIDTRSDVYALGVLLYELLVGSTPFDPEELRSKAYGEMQRIIREVEPPRPSTRLSTLADAGHTIASRRRIDAGKLGHLLKGELDWIVMRAMEKDRTRRYETANALAMDVQRHLDNEPVLARPPSTIYRLRKFARKHRAGVIGTGAVAAALLLAVVGTSIGLVRARAALGKSKTSEGIAIHQSEVSAKLLKDVVAARAAAEAQSRRARAANDFMGQMLGAGTSDGAGAMADMTVSKILDQASLRLDGLKDQPELELDARATLARGYTSLRQFDKAIANIDRALELSRAMTGPESEQTLQILGDAMNIPRSSGYVVAERMARTGAETARRVLGPRHPVTRNLLLSLGAIVGRQGKSADAEKIFRELTLQVGEPGYVVPVGGSARYFLNLAQAVLAQGRLAEGEQIQRQAIEVASREKPVPRGGLLMAELAETYYRECKFPEAEKMFREALAYQRRALGAAHPDTMETMFQLTAVLEQRAAYSQSLELLDEILAWHAAQPDNDPTVYAWELQHSGELQLRLGHDAQAAARFEQAMAVLQKVPPAPSDAADAMQKLPWTKINLLQGLRIDRAWAGPGIKAEAQLIAWAALGDHKWNTTDLKEVQWAKLRFKIQPWRGDSESADGRPRAKTPGASRASDVVEGGLSELWARPDPKPGIYLFSISVPRRSGPPIREADWICIAPWKVSLFAATMDQANDSQKWRKLLASPPLEQRAQSTVCNIHFGYMNRGFGPFHARMHFALAAEVTQPLPPGKYYIGAKTSGACRVFNNGNLSIDAWNTTATPATITVSPSDPPNAFRIESYFADAEQNLFGGHYLVFSVSPIGEQAEAMLAAEVGLSPIEAVIEYDSSEIARGISTAAVFKSRGISRTQAGLFQDAEKDLDKSIQLDPTDHWTWYYRGCILAYLGNTPAYRATCAGMLEKFGGTDAIDVLDRTIKTCLLLPSPADPKKLRALADRYLNDASRNVEPNPNVYLCHAMACYRDGDYAQCLKSAAECTRIDHDSDRCLSIAAHSLIAITRERSGQHADSAAALLRARNLAKALPKPGVQSLGNNPEDWLVAQVLLREAIQTIPGAKAATQPAH
ncbi:MAG TPA: serine/threonine-protein kinase [Tepidisphaeraceae bacterium]|nr:serine/threonine-protein kinase [Tepidisphaeraceae bacterium]